MYNLPMKRVLILAGLVSVIGALVCIGLYLSGLLAASDRGIGAASRNVNECQFVLEQTSAAPPWLFIEFSGLFYGGYRLGPIMKGRNAPSMSE